MRAQAALEYMILIGFLLAVLVPMIVLFYSKSSETSAQVRSEQAKALGQKIADSAESVYYLGQPSKFQFRANVPDGISSVNFTDKEIAFRIQLVPGTTDVVIPSTVNLSGSIKTSVGVHLITVENKGTYVFVNST